MKILILGAGVISTTYAWQLSNAGYDVTLTILPDTRYGIPWSGPDRETPIQAILEAALP